MRFLRLPFASTPATHALFLLLAAAGAATARGDETAAPAPSGPVARIYKEVDGRGLTVLIDRPPGWQASDQRPAVIFFFGGGFVQGSPEQFRPQSEYLASRGLIGFRVEYRLLARDDRGPPTICVQDAKSVLRWVRAHAAELGVDPARIAAAGGSAGGYLAAMTGLVEGLDDPQDDLRISPRPQALILFNPLVNLGPGQTAHARVGDDYRAFSPAHHVTAAAPPTIIFLGTKDNLIPVSVIEEFAAAMQAAGARCEAIFTPGAPHGFFNRDPHRTRTLIATDRFLISLGWLQGEPD